MTKETSIKECLEVAKDCKTATGFYVFNAPMLLNILELAYNGGEIAGDAAAHKRLDNILSNTKS